MAWNWHKNNLQDIFVAGFLCVLDIWLSCRFPFTYQSHGYASWDDAGTAGHLRSAYEPSEAGSEATSAAGKPTNPMAQPSSRGGRRREGRVGGRVEDGWKVASGGPELLITSRSSSYTDLSSKSVFFAEFVFDRTINWCLLETVRA